LSKPRQAKQGLGNEDAMNTDGRFARSFLLRLPLEQHCSIVVVLQDSQVVWFCQTRMVALQGVFAAAAAGAAL